MLSFRVSCISIAAAISASWASAQTPPAPASDAFLTQYQQAVAAADDALKTDKSADAQMQALISARRDIVRIQALLGQQAESISSQLNTGRSASSFGIPYPAAATDAGIDVRGMTDEELQAEIDKRKAAQEKLIVAPGGAAPAAETKTPSPNAPESPSSNGVSEGLKPNQPSATTIAPNGPTRVLAELRAEQGLRRFIKENDQRTAAQNETLNAYDAALTALDTYLQRIDDRAQNLLRQSSEQSLYTTVSTAMLVFLVGLVIVLFFLVALRDDRVRSVIFAGDAGIQFVTLFSLVIAIILFGVLRILEGRELAALLGGLSGYILGKGSQQSAPEAIAPPKPSPELVK